MVNHHPIAGETCPNSVEDPAVKNVLLRIVVRLERNPSSRDDLMQEGLVHYWLEVERRPGHSLSWYLQSCQFHLRHYLAAGRSVDSPKRGSARVYASLESDDPDDLFEPPDCGGGVLSEVSANEIIELLSSRLERRGREILGWLAEGIGPAEIAKRLNVSHPAVIKQRRKIVALAAEFGITPS